jgi:DNA-binding MarR family transcriptional regulator
MHYLVYNEDTMKPDFLIIPLVLQHDHRIRPSDLIIYGVIYWYEHLRDGECRAGNESIGEVAGIDVRTVRAGLDRLERAGYINRVYKDEDRKIRDRIECMVAFKYAQQAKLKFPKALDTQHPHEETPGEYARRFFSGDQVVIEALVQDLLKVTQGKGEEGIKVEMRKFFSYWTEPNKSGTKVKWELERTFDVKRRLYTWLNRASERRGAGSRAAGAGTVV